MRWIAVGSRPLLDTVSTKESGPRSRQHLILANALHHIHMVDNFLFGYPGDT